MEISSFCTRLNVLVLLVTLCSPCKFIQSPMDFGPLNILQTTTTASTDFGRMVFNSPSAVLRPESPKDISLLLSFLYSSSYSQVTVAARGAGHSLYGQAQAPGGIVIEMEYIPFTIVINKREEGEPTFSYADVSGGALWIELLEESLKVGLAPRSWTDYLYLSIGGTLSNAGISGQTFKYGPQISNVLQLDIVTGRGELVTCSPTKSPELFHAALGGLGQFGIITSARILLQEAPQKVKWFRAFYNDFETFTRDQELLVSIPDMVDYVEGFIVLNEQSLLSSSVAFPAHLGFIPELQKDRSKVYYCIEFAVHYFQDRESNAGEIAKEVIRKLSYMPSFIYSTEVSYYDFLNRVRMEEVSLSRRGLWDVPHPWLNMFVPKSGIKEFKDLVMESISPENYQGLILIYPLLRDKWGTNMSAVLPGNDTDTERVVYVVGMLRSADPSGCSPQCLRDLIRRNGRLAEAATGGRIGAKQYLAHHGSPEAWRRHFGGRWEQFASRKSEFDPLNVLSPGQGIFPRVYGYAAATAARSTKTLLRPSQ